LSEAHRNVETFGDKITQLFACNELKREFRIASLAELRSVRGKLGLPVERDLHFDADKTFSAYADEARTRGHIVA
jgi:hypothetical protein